MLGNYLNFVSCTILNFGVKCQAADHSFTEWIATEFFLKRQRSLGFDPLLNFFTINFLKKKKEKKGQAD
jgi:hypothetical protein